MFLGEFEVFFSNSVEAFRLTYGLIGILYLLGRFRCIYLVHAGVTLKSNIDHIFLAIDFLIKTF